jgi:hypothetical protein
MIKLIDTKHEIVDSVSLSYEDSFTLDTFEDMIKASHAVDKSFILARVATADPKQPDKSFYSYYDAYQLNKVLFQTQVIKGKKYIHRLHVLNPLSNLDIVGDVLYFHVKPIKNKMLESQKESHQTKDLVPSESARKTDAKSSAQWTLAGPISSPLTEDFLDDYKKPSANRAVTYPVVRPLEMAQIKDNFTIDMAQVNAPDAISPENLKPFTLFIQERKVSILPKGALTRYNSPVSENLPDPKRGNRRAFSWMNTNNFLKKQLNFEEWRALAKKYKETNEEVDFDKVENIAEISKPSIDATTETEYEAILFATDNDFLESVKTRSFFRANAMSPDDNKLFEMPVIEETEHIAASVDDIIGAWFF